MTLAQAIIDLDPLMPLLRKMEIVERDYACVIADRDQLQKLTESQTKMIADQRLQLVQAHQDIRMLAMMLREFGVMQAGSGIGCVRPELMDGSRHQDGARLNEDAGVLGSAPRPNALTNGARIWRNALQETLGL